VGGSDGGKYEVECEERRERDEEEKRGILMKKKYGA